MSAAPVACALDHNCSAMHDQHKDLLLQLTHVPLVTADSEDSQAGHVQDGPASVSDDAAREEADPSRGASTENPSPAAAVTSSGRIAVSDLTSVCASMFNVYLSTATAITTTTLNVPGSPCLDQKSAAPPPPPSPSQLPPPPRFPSPP